MIKSAPSGGGVNSLDQKGEVHWSWRWRSKESLPVRASDFMRSFWMMARTSWMGLRNEGALFRSEVSLWLSWISGVVLDGSFVGLLFLSWLSRGTLLVVSLGEGTGAFAIEALESLPLPREVPPRLAMMAEG